MQKSREKGAGLPEFVRSGACGAADETPAYPIQGHSGLTALRPVVDTSPGRAGGDPVEAHLGRDRGHRAVGSRDYSCAECVNGGR
jgi:hypothetical protein